MGNPENDLRRLENVAHARDWEALESWRPRVRPENVAALVALYDRVKTWNERCAVLQLLQDERASGPPSGTAKRRDTPACLRRRRRSMT